MITLLQAHEYRIQYYKPKEANQTDNSHIIKPKKVLETY